MVTELGQHWFRQWLVARHQAITWTNVDLSSVKSCGIHLRAVYWGMLKIPNLKYEFEIYWFNITATSPWDQWVNGLEKSCYIVIFCIFLLQILLIFPAMKYDLSGKNMIWEGLIYMAVLITHFGLFLLEPFPHFWSDAQRRCLWVKQYKESAMQSCKSFVPGQWGLNLKLVIFKLISSKGIFSISC